MANGIWPAVSGAVAKERTIDTVANNLANANTTAYKADSLTFKEYLSHQERSNELTDIPPGPVRDRDLYPIDGRDQSFVITDGSYTNFTQGGLRETRNPYDVALNGKGFFEVSTPDGVRYTRHGSFKMATDGLLVTPDGHPVLATQPQGLAIAQPPLAVQPSQGGPVTQGGVAAGQPQQYPPEILPRLINLRDRDNNITITDRGEIYTGDELIAQLAVTEFNEPRVLRKEGSQLFENPDPANVSAQPLQTRVVHGMLELSNVNPVKEMSNLIRAHRSFEQDLKAIKTYDAIMDRTANTIGKL